MNSVIFAILVASAAALSFDTEGAKRQPVRKVVELLQDMQKQLEKEGKEDQEVYDKTACWCKTNLKDKAQSAAAEKARIEQLESKVNEYTATNARLDVEIKTLSTEVAENQKSLDEASALRSKQQAQFQAEEKDLVSSISALKAAVIVLSKSKAGALLQGARSQLPGAVESLRLQLLRHSDLLKGTFTPEERRVLEAFVQNAGAQAPSGEILGMLKQMGETFQTNLDTSRKEEAQNEETHNGLKTAKEQEIEAGKLQLETKKQELADAGIKLAEAKQDIADTQAALGQDSSFLEAVKEKCKKTDEEWEIRQKTRADETTAVAQAISILNSDEARDTFGRTSPSLLQERSVIRSVRRTRASVVLASAAKKLQKPRLALLSSQVKLDNFERVKKAIDDLVGALKKEQQDEVQKKDYCGEEFNKNERDTERKVRANEEITARAQDLERTIKVTDDAISTLKAEVADLEVQLKTASQDREKANADFQHVLADQREAQKLLKQAIEALGAFYSQPTTTKAPALVQLKAEPATDAPAPFQDYKTNGASVGVISLLEQILEDAKTAEAAATRAETESQSSYETIVKDTKSSVEAKNKDVADKEKVKAQAEMDLIQAKTSSDGVTAELAQLSDYNAQLHTSCDFLLKNFDVRQTAREEEVEALRQAKAILSGAKFEAFLQGA